VDLDLVNFLVYYSMNQIEIRDVVTIIFAVLSLAGLYYALKRSVDRLYNKVTTMEQNHDRDIELIKDGMKETKADIDKREKQVYDRITEIKEEQKNAIDKIEIKIDAISTNLASMNTCLSELTGYIKAKKA
jgi:ABC-type siderophore export system fused ATPase/permease subunit